VGVVVALSLVCVVAMGAIVGSMLPFFFKSLNLDPAVISSPLLAQTVDIVGALVFYNIAYAVVTYWSAVKAGGG
jgi:magnesium transporter